MEVLYLFIPSVLLLASMFIKPVPLSVFTALSVLAININLIVFYFFVSGSVYSALLLAAYELGLLLLVHVLMALLGTRLRLVQYKLLILLSTMPFAAFFL